MRLHVTPDEAKWILLAIRHANESLASTLKEHAGSLALSTLRDKIETQIIKQTNEGRN